MTPEFWDRVETIYQSALDRDEGDRRAYVAAACGEDRALHVEVLELLAHARVDSEGLRQPIGLLANELDQRLDAVRPGQQFGTYRIDERLGRGGMGEVYRARDLTLGRDVALKILPEAFIRDMTRVARFRQEAQILASLNHPHIGAIYGLEQHGGIPFLALELVDGLTLGHRLKGGALPVADALSIAEQIADALAAAHDRGIIHRDLKPDNIGLTRDGRVKVLDFGLARIVEGGSVASDDRAPSTAHVSTRKSEVGVLFGTAAYMSPEQLRGRAADQRTDVWAFGCVLYEMLTGTPAFLRPQRADTLAAVLRDSPDWTVLPTGLSRPVRTLLRRCLMKDERQRSGSLAIMTSAAGFTRRNGNAVEVKPNAEGRPLDALILKALIGGPIHFYAIARFIEDATGMAVLIRYGELYSALDRLQQKGCVEAEWGMSELGRPANLYRISESGREQLAIEILAWEKFSTGVSKALFAR